MAKYEYHEYTRQQFASVKELNGLMEIVLSSGKGLVDSVVAGVKVGIVFTVMCARSKVIGDQMEMEKRGYEIDRSNRNDEEIGSDPLDVERRPGS
jgi:hypothetical protein